MNQENREMNVSAFSARVFAAAKAAGVEPWVYYPNDATESYEGGVNNGAMLITANNPAKCLEYLRSRGLHE